MYKDTCFPRSSHATGPRHPLPQRAGALLLLAIPVVLSELGWMAMSIVDTIMVGRLSPAAIGAVAISSAIFYTPALFGMACSWDSTPWSPRPSAAAILTIATGLAQGVYLASPIHRSPCCWWASPPSVSSVGITETVRAPAREYIQLLNWSALPLLIYVAFRRYLQGVARCGR